MVDQHFRDGYRGEEDVNKGEIGKEKIHGVVKVNVRANGQDDEQVSDQCDGVNEQEEDEEEVFLLLLTTDSQENETKGKRLVVSSHPLMDPSAERGEESRIISKVIACNGLPKPPLLSPVVVVSILRCAKSNKLQGKSLFVSEPNFHVLETLLGFVEKL